MLPVKLSGHTQVPHSDVLQTPKYQYEYIGNGVQHLPYPWVLYSVRLPRATKDIWRTRVNWWPVFLSKYCFNISIKHGWRNLTNGLVIPLYRQHSFHQEAPISSMNQCHGDKAQSCSRSEPLVLLNTELDLSLKSPWQI